MDTAHRSILIVEDEKNVRELLTLVISQHYHCVAAASGEEALKLFGEIRFDLVISDLSLPGLSGVQLCENIRKMQPDTPILLISGGGNDLDEMAAKYDYTYIIKPFRIEELLEKIESALTQI